MIPHTVAEQADEGRGRADGGDDAGPARHRAGCARLDARERQARTLLDAFGRQAARALHLIAGGLDHRSDGAGSMPHVTGVPLETVRRTECPDGGTGAPCRDSESRTLGDPDRPGDERREGQSEHHRFDDAVGVEEHSPGRQVMRQWRPGWIAGKGHGRCRGAERTARRSRSKARLQIVTSGRRPRRPPSSAEQPAGPADRRPSATAAWESGFPRHHGMAPEMVGSRPSDPSPFVPRGPWSRQGASVPRISIVPARGP